MKFILGNKLYASPFIQRNKVLKSATCISLAVLADQLPDVLSQSIATSVPFCAKTTLLPTVQSAKIAGRGSVSYEIGDTLLRKNLN